MTDEPNENHKDEPLVPLPARVPKSMRDAVDVLAKRRDRSVSWIVRDAMKAYLEKADVN